MLLSTQFSSLTILCISPISIKNPNYGLCPKAGTALALKDCSSNYIRVPCGHCPECIASRQLQLVQRVQMESLSNYVFFCTLTYNRDSLPHVKTSTGFSLPYADISDLQNMFKRLRKYNSFSRPFKYMAVSERGSKRGRPHFHVLFFLPKYDADSEYTPFNLEKLLYEKVLKEWRRNYGTSRKPIYKPLLTFKAVFKNGKLFSPYDLHFVHSSIDDTSSANVAFYVTKYMLKPSDKETKLQQALRLNLPEDEYFSIWNIVRSRFVCSKHFGLNLSPFGDIDDKIYNHIRFGVKLSELDDFPKFFNPDSGNSFPLSKYYRSNGELYGLLDCLPRYFNSPSSDIDSPSQYDDKDYNGLLKSFSDYEFKKNIASERGSIDDFGDSFV